MSTKAVFIDKDGTLIQDIPYNVDPDKITLLPGAAQGLRKLSLAGYRIVIVSNQSGVARGMFPEDALIPVERRLNELLRQEGVRLDGFYYCPHHPQGKVPRYAIPCSCRKPQPGLVLRAAKERGLDPARSWLIGDILDDIEAGKTAGCKTILIENGSETEWLMSTVRTSDEFASNLDQAADIILSYRRHNAPDTSRWPPERWPPEVGRPRTRA